MTYTVDATLVRALTWSVSKVVEPMLLTELTTRSWHKIAHGGLGVGVLLRVEALTFAQAEPFWQGSESIVQLHVLCLG